MSLSKNIIVVVVIVTTFALGRYSVQEPEVKLDIVTDKQTDTHKVQNKKKITTITKDKDGKEVTTITEEDVITTDKNSNSTSKISETITPPKTNTINISALAGMSLDRFGTPVYGVSITKQLIGPITVGAFGLTDKTIGLSIGLNF